uniref:Uncharacterized protein n=1 Tax=Cucumis sativus TaxID=3659 RepID=A0A0A0LXA7_CUCSA
MAKPCDKMPAVYISESFFAWRSNFAQITSKSLCIKSFPLKERSTQRRARSLHSVAVRMSFRIRSEMAGFSSESQLSAAIKPEFNSSSLSRISFHLDANTLTE